MVFTRNITVPKLFFQQIYTNEAQAQGSQRPAGANIASEASEASKASEAVGEANCFFSWVFFVLTTMTEPKKKLCTFTKFSQDVYMTLMIVERSEFKFYLDSSDL